MNWYYADNGQQAGPVDETQFQALIQSGRITPETLVWREGMANWLPLREVNPPGALASSPLTEAAPLDPNQPAAAATAPVPVGQVTCVECRSIFPKEQCIQYGTTWVCATCKPIFVQRLQEGASRMGGYEGAFDYGGFWIRVGAKLIDSIIMGVLVMIPVALIFFLAWGTQGPGSQPPDSAFLAMQILFQLGSILIVVAYNTFFIAKYAATPGKMVCGLKVVMADGSRVSGWRAFGRAWADQLSAMICYIGYIIVAFDEEKRALHDHICNTRVVRK